MRSSVGAPPPDTLTPGISTAFIESYASHLPTENAVIRMGVIPAPEALSTVPIIPSANPLPPPLLSMERTPTSMLPAPIHTLSSNPSSNQGTSSIATQPPHTLSVSQQHSTAIPGGSFMGDALCPLPEPLQKPILNLRVCGHGRFAAGGLAVCGRYR